jgi:3-oxoacyl-[acyl-carrier-protein] synthase III
MDPLALGIERRHFAAEGETTSDLAVHAAARARRCRAHAADLDASSSPPRPPI